MYETFQSLLRLAISMGEIQNAEFNADHGEYRQKGIRVSVIADNGEMVNISMECKKANADA